MKINTWIVAVVVASCLVCTAAAGEPKVPSATHIEIRCPLPGSTTVRSIVNDGSSVEEGDVILTFDDAKIRADVMRSQIEVETANAELIAAKTNLQRSESQKDEVDVAELALKVAELRHRQCSAQLESELKMLDRQIEIAKKSLELAKRLFEKRGGSSGESDSVEAAAAELEMLKMKAEFEAALTKRQMLELMRPLREAELELAMKRTRLDLAKIKRMAAGEQQAARAATEAREQVMRVKQDKLKQLEDLLEQCTVRAPRDGKVHHAGPVPISEGSLVRQRQPLLILVGEGQ